MRIAFEQQPTLDCPRPDKVALNLQCRDEIVPILRALQFIYADAGRRKTILGLVGKDVNRTSSKKLGRLGLSYWEVTVLAAVRLGCNLDYDKLQNLAEEHRTLRLMMGIGSWQEFQNDEDQKKKKRRSSIGGRSATTCVCCVRRRCNS